MRARVVLALAMALVWSVAASAQQLQPVTYVADFHVKPGKEEEFLNLVKEFNEPLFEKLMADGAVLAWGIDIPVLHQVGAPTHSLWWTSSDMAAFDKVFAAFEEQEKKIREEEARRRRRQAPKTVIERFREAVDLSKHRDWLFRELVVGYSDTPPPAGAKPYTRVATTRVLPGEAQEFQRLWVKYVKPILDAQLAEGNLGAYGFGIEEVRTTDEFSHFTWASLPNLAAWEKVRTAFIAANAARSPEERRQITQSFLNVVDPSANRVVVLRAVIFHVASPE